MKQKLINLYNLVFFKNPKRPYLLWWQAVLVYLQWAVIITSVIVLFDINVEQHKNPPAIYLSLFFLIVFGAYAALDQKLKEVKTRFLFFNGFLVNGKIIKIKKSNIISRLLFELFTGSIYEITYVYNNQTKQILFYRKKLQKFFPDLSEGSEINILVSKNHPNYFIWDFATTYFNINRNYKKCEK